MENNSPLFCTPPERATFKCISWSLLVSGSLFLNASSWGYFPLSPPPTAPILRLALPKLMSKNSLNSVSPFVISIRFPGHCISRSKSRKGTLSWHREGKAIPEMMVKDGLEKLVPVGARRWRLSEGRLRGETQYSDSLPGKTWFK